MPYDFVIDQERQLIRVRYSGVVTLEERRAGAQHVLGEAAGPDMRRILLDYRPATSLARDEAAADALVDYLVRTLGERRARIAWLVNYDHQLDPLVEGKLREGGIATARFRDPDAALAAMYYDTIVQDTRALRFLADVVGAERIMMGSDMPFPIGDLAPLKIVQDTSFSDAERASINGGLVQKLFGL